MILLLSIVLGLAMGLAAGGKLSHLSGASLRGETALLISLVVQMAAPALPSITPLLSSAVLPAWVIGAVLVCAISLANIHSVGMPAILVGAVFNLLTVAANRGMPVSLALARIAGLPEPKDPLFLADTLHVPMTGTTSLPILGDILPVTGPESLQAMVSLGDMLMVVGVAAFLVAAMTKRTSKKRSTRFALASGP